MVQPMSPRRPRTRSIQDVIELLGNPDFCDDARRLIAAAATLREQGSPLEEWLRKVGERAAPVRARWGVLPPQTGELLAPDPRRRT